MRNVCLLLLLASVGLACPAMPQSPCASLESVLREPNVLIDLQVVALPEKIALPLLPELRDGSKVEAAYQKVQEHILKGTAKLIGWPMLTTRSGGRAAVQAINELQFADRFDSAGIGVSLTMPDAKLVRESEKAKGLELNGLPTDFAAHDVGVTLEIDPVVDPGGKTISLNIFSRHVRFKAMNKLKIQRENTGTETVVDQPEFESHGVTTSLRMKSGERMLLGVFKTSEPPDHIELFILRAEVQKTK